MIRVTDRDGTCHDFKDATRFIFDKDTMVLSVIERVSPKGDAYGGRLTRPDYDKTIASFRDWAYVVEVEEKVEKD